MDLYDVLSKGCRAPLTSEQIAELFRAGRFGREVQCRPVGATSWRTLDELFPLLKYDAGAYSSGPNDWEHPRVSLRSALPFALVISLFGAVAFFVWNRTVDHIIKGNPIVWVPHHHQRTIPSTFPSAALGSQQTYSSSQAPPYRASVADRTGFDQERQAAEQRQREQTSREQAAFAERMRAEAEQRASDAKNAAGTDYHVPLDENYYIPMPGAGVWVKVHDNDVTSFDIWINGAWHRDITKEKGITHSGTDETFVYSNGQASLYYVWEISGPVNSCLLRVREH